MAPFNTKTKGVSTSDTLNTEQRVAHSALQAYLVQKVRDKFERETTMVRLFKTKIAFYISMRCNKHPCYFIWSINYNIKTKKAFIYNKETLCDHYETLGGIFKGQTATKLVI